MNEWNKVVEKKFSLIRDTKLIEWKENEDIIGIQQRIPSLLLFLLSFEEKEFCVGPIAF